MTESDMFLDKIKHNLSVHDSDKVLNDAMKIAKKMDPELYYWKDLETWIAEEGGSRILFDWYDRIFKLTDGKFLDETRKKLLYKNYKMDVLDMIKDRYSLDDWDLRQEFMDFHGEDKKEEDQGEDTK